MDGINRFLHPLVYGDYPSIMRSVVKERLPKFTEEETILIRESFDFLGFNYYTTNYVKDSSSEDITEPSYLTDLCATITSICLISNFLYYILNFN